MEIFGDEPDPAAQEALPLGLYLRLPDQPNAPLYSLRPLLERVGDVSWLDTAEPDDWQILAMDYAVAITPGYRLDGACDRIALMNVLEGRTAEVFPIPYEAGPALLLVDSVGQAQGSLLPMGAEAPHSERPPVPAPGGPGRVRFDAATATLDTELGALDLRAVFPYGRWHARPPRVRYKGSDLVIWNVCDPYDRASDFCGLQLDSSGERPLADVPGPIYSVFAVTLVPEARSVRVEPFDPGVSPSGGVSAGGLDLSPLPPGRPTSYPLAR